MGKRDFIKRVPALPFRRVVGLSFSRNKHLNLKCSIPFFALSLPLFALSTVFLPLSVWGRDLLKSKFGSFWSLAEPLRHKPCLEKKQ